MIFNELTTQQKTDLYNRYDDINHYVINKPSKQINKDILNIRRKAKKLVYYKKIKTL